ncbi:MAG: cation diffusion facilitator family transporter [Candidatus Woesearchaeota archaeon]
MKTSEKLTLIGVFVNFILFSLKIVVGFLSNSLSLISDAFNSLGDIVSYTAIFLAVKIAHKKPDQDHPFGHSRAEPIAGFVVSIFTFILAVEVFKNSLFSFFENRTYNYEVYALIVLFFTIFVKALMSYFYYKIGLKENSPALKAGSIDSRNDVLISFIAFIGVIGTLVNITKLDNIASLIISFYIFYSGYKIAKENIDYLMGKSAPLENIKEIKKIAKKVKGVINVHDLRAHYVGNFLHLEIHIAVNENLSTKDSHRIGKEVQFRLERLPYVDKAFIHIDPY